MSYGVTPEGFSRPDFATIRAALEQLAVTAYGPGVVLVGGVVGRFLDLLTEREDLLWQAMQAVNESRTPSGAVGLALDDLAALTGTFRQAPIASTVTLTLTGTPGTVVAAGFLARIPNQTLATFSTLAAVTLDGTGHADAPARCLVTGPVAATAGSLTEVVTPTTGVSSVTSFTDALLGTDAADHKNGTQAARLENTGRLTMGFYLPNGASTVTVQHAVYGTDASSGWELWAQAQGCNCA